MPHNNELHPDLPEGPEPGQSDRGNQEDAGGTPPLEQAITTRRYAARRVILQNSNGAS